MPRVSETNQFKFFWFFLALFILSGLSTSDSWSDQPPAKVADGMETPAPISIDKAAQLAEVHLALRNVRWGKPSERTEDETRFVFTYDTPVAEQRVLGLRRISVDKKTGLVRVRDK